MAQTTQKNCITKSKACQYSSINLVNKILILVDLTCQKQPTAQFIVIWLFFNDAHQLTEF